MPAEVGTKAPDFTLVNQDRQPVTLSKEIGSLPVVLAFFPAAFSSVCTKELCAFRDDLALTVKSVKSAKSGQSGLSNARVLGISVDTPFALKAFADQQKLNFPLLSDFNKDVIRQYGVFNEDMIGLKGIAKRAVFVVDENGVIRYREVLEDARNEPDYAKLSQALFPH